MFTKKNNAFLLPLGFLILSGVLGFSAYVSAAPSDVHIELSRETYPEVKIAIQSFELQGDNQDVLGLGREGRTILENDLVLSEFFDPIRYEVFEDLEKQDRTNGASLKEWNRLGAQWMVQSQYTINPKQGLYTFVFRLYDVVHERFLLGKKYRAPKDFHRRIIHRFADELVSQLTGKRGVAETRLAFISKGLKGKEVYLIDFDGYNVDRLTHDNSVTLSPAWSPDSKHLLFTSYAQHNPDLIMVTAAGKNRRTLLKIPGLNAAPAWAPDGSKIALTLSKDFNAEIYILEKSMRLIRLTRHFNIDTSPAWSPDGKKIAFTSDRSGTAAPQIFIMDARLGDSIKLERISFNSSYNDDPAWSPEGDMIAYTSRVRRKFRIKIYNVKTKTTLDFTSGRGSQENPSWSPDGRYLAYSHQEGGKTEIYIKRLGSDKTRRLTLSGNGIMPDWSPYLKN